MPSVVIKTEEVQGDILAQFANELRPIVAAALTGEEPGAKVEPAQVIVRFADIGECDDDLGALFIEVKARKYPSRLANLDERGDRIASELARLPCLASLKGLSGSDEPVDRAWLSVELVDGTLKRIF